MDLKGVIFLCPHLPGEDTEVSGGGDLPTVPGLTNHESEHFGAALENKPCVLVKTFYFLV